MNDTVIIIILVAVIIVIILAIWKLPIYQIKDFKSIKESDKFNLENEARKTLVQIFGGIFFLGTLFFSWNSYKLSINDQLSKRFSETISLFTNEKVNARVAAIYSLENLAHEYIKERETIYQLLVSYVKEKTVQERITKDTNWLSDKYYSSCSNYIYIDRFSIKRDSANLISSDIQAAINSLLRMKKLYNRKEYLDLSNLNLEGLRIKDLDISGVDFRYSNLKYSKFENVKCETESLFAEATMNFLEIDGIFIDVNFYRANIENGLFRGSFYDCQFGESNLYNSQFEGGEFYNPLFWSANMTNTFFEREVSISEPVFENTILNCADISQLQIPKEKFKNSIINEKTRLPQY